MDAKRTSTASVAAELEPTVDTSGRGQFRLNKVEARYRIGSEDDYRAGRQIAVFDWECLLNKNIPFSFQIATAAIIQSEWYAKLRSLSPNKRSRHVAGACQIALQQSRGYRLWESPLPQVQGFTIDPTVNFGFWRRVGDSDAIIRASTKVHLLQRRAIFRVGGILTLPDLPSPFAQFEYDTLRRSSSLSVGINFGQIAVDFTVRH